MDKTDYIQLKQLLTPGKKVVIVPHINPDGDAMGSCFGLYHYLKSLKMDAQVIAPNDYPNFLKWLPGQNEVLIYDSNKETADNFIKEADIIFTLDFNALNRTGDMQSSLEKATATFVLIDHHQQPDSYASFIYSDVSMSSTCEMIYHFIDKLGDLNQLTPEIATSLYTGIMTDTGSFRFPSCSPTTYRVAAHLIEGGANHSEIHNNIYDTNSADKLQLLGCALKNLNILPEYKTAYITLTSEELEAHNFRKGDTEGFVNYGLSVEGVVLAAIFIENRQEKIIKISFRSKGDFSVNDLARNHFNGGGHINAAGGKSDLSMNATVEKFISILPPYKNALNQ